MIPFVSCLGPTSHSNRIKDDMEVGIISCATSTLHNRQSVALALLLS